MMRRLALLFVCGACAPITTRPIDEVLKEQATRVQVAREEARRNPKDPDALMDASVALAQAADLKLHRGLLADLKREPPDDVDDLLARRDKLDEAVRSDVLALAVEGGGLAKRAALLAPDRKDAVVYYALHMGLEAWAKGKTRALLEGFGGRLPRAIDKAVEMDPEYDNAAPLRLKGRFLSRAPWPYANKTLGRDLLVRAVTIEPLAIHHLYLAEVSWMLGEKEAAIEQWKAVRSADNDAATRGVLRAHRELARLALALARE